MIKKLLLLNCARLLARLPCYEWKVLKGKVQVDISNPSPGPGFLPGATSIGVNGKYSLFFPQPGIYQPIPVSSFIAFEQQKPVGVLRLPFVLMKINYGLFNY